MYNERRISISFPEQEQHEERSDHEEYADGENRVTHAPGDGFNDAETEGTCHGGQLFHHIIETEKGGMVGGIRQHLRIG